ncbi:hypothetical protein [Cupriavidus pauculus]|uniref:Ribosomal protein S3AE n=1 Tax=Cupriavidus pauculus TaxID=82633 RepID=A0A3G8H2V7_9BURK|nr:hypothetical protein [Cupriavidus pauculus]AZG14734.1 hypothetical protein EHF44_15555 [Cupriavidus pauculus]
MDSAIPIRTECPPGACDCRRELLLDDPAADRRILMLTQHEEKRLVARLEAIETLADLRRMQDRMRVQLGIVVTITPSDNEVRTVKGFDIDVADQPGLCRKTRAAIPAAIRRCMKTQPQIAFDLLNERDLLGGLFGQPPSQE